MKTKFMMFVKSSVPNREYSICPLKFVNGNLYRKCKKTLSDFKGEGMVLAGKYRVFSDILKFCVIRDVPILMRGGQ